MFVLFVREWVAFFASSFTGWGISWFLAGGYSVWGFFVRHATLFGIVWTTSDDTISDPVLPCHFWITTIAAEKKFCINIGATREAIK